LAIPQTPLYIQAKLTEEHNMNDSMCRPGPGNAI
jgi:hypothetical protein